MPGWNDSAETLIAGTGEVYVAPVGTALPANSETALNVAFNGLGYHTEEGVSVKLDSEIAEFKAWQSKYVIRSIRESDEFQITFVLQQWNEINVPLAFGGGEIVDLTGGQFRYNPPSPADAVDERALICDVADGTRKGRFVVPRGMAVEGVESEFTRSTTAHLPISFKALAPADESEPWYFLTNDAAAFAVGS